MRWYIRGYKFLIIFSQCTHNCTFMGRRRECRAELWRPTAVQNDGHSIGNSRSYMGQLVWNMLHKPPREGRAISLGLLGKMWVENQKKSEGVLNKNGQATVGACIVARPIVNRVCTHRWKVLQSLNTVISRAGNIYKLAENTMENCFIRRILPAGLGALPDLDLPGCPFLHGQHHAPVHHLRGPLFIATLPYEVWPE